MTDKVSPTTPAPPVSDCEICGGTGKTTAGCATDKPLIESDCWKCVKGKEILTRLRQIQDQELKDALAVLRRLCDGEQVPDGDLLDAAFAFTARTDLANPIVPIMSYFIERFMYSAGIPETPKGLKRDYFKVEHGDCEIRLSDIRPYGKRPLLDKPDKEWN